MQDNRQFREKSAQGMALSVLLVMLQFIAVGYAESADTSDAVGTEFFEKHVRPLLVARCFECHSTTESQGGLKLDSREGLRRGGDTGAAIVPGKPDQSLLIEAIRYKNRDLQMPPKKPLLPTEIIVLEKWIAMGAPDPRQPPADTAAPGPTGMSIEDGRAFWSFQPVADPPPPAVRDASWIRTPIDAFLLAKLEERGLQPALPADKRTLIRRATLDLIGLPPRSDEIEAFLADASPNAFANVVDRLLQSPQYGVRWARHWLDVARYADSNGLDENLAFGTAWRYRDYVVAAFNHDKPFDRFLIEQIAGDLVPEANEQTKTATGFLVLGAKVLAEPDREKLEMDTIDEQLDSTGKAFLGMTIGCVRCHDHKFDPLKQTDYYALAAFFKSTKTFGDTNYGAIKHWHEHSFASDDELERMKKVDADIATKRGVATKFKTDAIAKIRAAAREKATGYLMAAAQITPDTSLTQVEAIAQPLGLHARILHHCRLHLEYHRDDTLLGKWHELSVSGDLAGIERHYRPLFTAAQKPADKTPEEPLVAAARAALADLAGFLAVPPKPEFALDASSLAEYHRLSEEARVLESNAPDATTAMGVSDGKVVTQLPIHIRGNHRSFGALVARGFPEVMRTSSIAPILPRNQSGRLQLAQWMASTQHPLTARVFVNRVWRWHFGVGLVASPDNLGKLGDRPTHPELLDWLAREFMESGWSIKDLHRLILASNAYQMAADHSHEAVAFAADPENRLLWKFRAQRMEAEQIRDAVLAIAGRLNESLGGKSIPLRNRQFVFDHTSIDHTKYDSLRRAIYLPVVRNNLYTLFEQFDFPDPTMPTGSRNATVVAPQALFMMNSDLVMDSADEMARRVMSHTADGNGRVRWSYEEALGRPPTDSELQRAISFVNDLTSQTLAGSATVTPSAEHRAWSLFCQSLFASNEFIFVR